MDNYKTVKEVCALTGLTRKHLYYFHHENVVRASAYANYSVEGYDGYKLYDDAAVEKLQQIALYYQLGLKRDEIKKIMLAPNYDRKMMLQNLLTREQEKRIHIERNIAALEYIILAERNDRISSPLHGISLDELGQMLLKAREVSAENSLPSMVSGKSAAGFAKELSPLITEFARMDENLLQTRPGTAVIQRIIDLSNRYLCSDSAAFVLALCISPLDGDFIAPDIKEKLTPSHTRAVIQYMIDHPQIFSHNPHGDTDGGSKNDGRNKK